MKVRRAAGAGLLAVSAAAAIPAAAQGQTAGSTPLIRVAQETLGPGGTGNRDFDDNVIGVVRAFDRSTRAPCNVYSYAGRVYNGNLLGPAGSGLTDDRAHTIFATLAAPTETASCTASATPPCSSPAAGAAMFWLFDDSVDDPRPGNCKSSARILNAPAACMSVFDGDSDTGDDGFVITGSGNDRTFHATNGWTVRLSDGYVISQLGASWTIEASFADYAGSNPAITVLSGLSSWAVYSADGPVFPLALTASSNGAGQRTAQFRPLAPCEVVAYPSKLTGDVCPAVFRVAVNAQGAIGYQWQRFTGGQWVNVASGGGASFALNGSTRASAGQYRCVVTLPAPCTPATATSNVVTLIPCARDFNCDGSVSVQDLFDFLGAYFSNSPAADVNGVGGVTVQDIFDFMAVYFSGC